MSHSAAKHRRLFRTLLIIVIIAAVAAAVIYYVVLPKIEETAYSRLITEASENAAETGSGTETSADKVISVYHSMSSKDKAKIRSILSKCVDASSTAKIYSYVKNNDTEGLKQFAQEKLSAEEIAELYSIYEKYQ